MYFLKEKIIWMKNKYFKYSKKIELFILIKYGSEMNNSSKIPVHK